MKHSPPLRRPITLRVILLAAGLAAAGWFWQALPDPLFDVPFAFVLEDRTGELLGARIAEDEQWRFPPRPDVAPAFATAIIQFEDRRFDLHPGIDVFALARAVWQNASEQRVVSGASTLSMQVIRLARKGRPRTVSEKVIEALMAIRLELRYSKSEILALYAAHAPFGGNVVGLEAASWRYFSRAPHQLSWSEAATLAVLPNNPALVHPGRNRELLRQKRDRLLDRLASAGYIDALTVRLARAEPLPEHPLPLTDLAPHLLNSVRSAGPATQRRVQTTLDATLQRRIRDLIETHRDRLEATGIYNAAALIVDNRTGQTLAYVGNMPGAGDNTHGREVDIVRAPRSTGSILKPFLYAALLDDGMLLPRTLVADIPTRFGGFAPVNFNEGFEGAVHADEALARSLNVPAVRLLRSYGVARFHPLLQSLGMTTLTRPPSHYGLSLILGGSEGTLWDMAELYAGMARTLATYDPDTSRVIPAPSPIQYLLASNPQPRSPALGAASIWLTLEALAEVKRPEAEGLWENFFSSRKIAWKTGTSYGFRDAWAVGITPDYTVAVWAGNADGEGRPGLTGVLAAGPLLFDIFDALDIEDRWFAQPVEDMEFIDICPESGHRAGSYCPSPHGSWVGRSGLRTEPCPYHRDIHLDATATWRVHGDCVPPDEMVRASWFVLPPAMEWFYKSKQGSYSPLPPFRPDCQTARRLQENEPAMEFIYPRHETILYVPIELDGTPGQAILEMAHRVANSRVHWHIDDTYMGTTTHFHQLAVRPTPGEHTVVVIDQNGERIQQSFVVATTR